jgi:hypothetical protein
MGPQALFLCVEELSGRRNARASDRRQVRLATAEEVGLFAIAAGSPVIHLIHNAASEWFQSRHVMPPAYALQPRGTHRTATERHTAHE